MTWVEFKAWACRAYRVLAWDLGFRVWGLVGVSSCWLPGLGSTFFGVVWI